MPKIFPFRGWHYNQNQITDLSQVISPPYDVITAALQDELYSRHPHNFVRIILNKEDGERRYSESARILAEWKTKEMVIQDSEEAIYLLSQSFQQDGQPLQRIGFIAELELEDLGQGVLPHEQTIEKHLQDRFRLMEATSTNPGQIFMAYRDQEMIVETISESVTQSEPLIDVILDENVRYRIWRITDRGQVALIRNKLRQTKAIIADGHHRYVTALRFSREFPNQPGTDRVMVTLVNAYNPGMDILPTHRLVKNCDLSITEIIRLLEPSFTVTSYSTAGELLTIMNQSPEDETVRLGFYHRISDTSLLLTYKNKDRQSSPLTDYSEAYRNLDVTILHELVLKRALKLDSTVQRDLERLAYLRGSSLPLEQLKSVHDYDIACFVKPPNIDTVFSIAEAGETMPQKSTFFYPKVYSGLVFRCFGNNGFSLHERM